MRNASGHQGKKERRRKNVNRTTYKISSIKRVTRKFPEVSRCRLAKQRERKKQTKGAARAKLLLLLFMLIRPIVVVVFAVFVAVNTWLALQIP